MKKIPLLLLLSIICQNGMSQIDVLEYVYTPKGDTVYAWITFESDSSFRDYLDIQYAIAYPEATFFTTYDGKSSTRRFNCHGYAWHMVETVWGLNDHRWIGLYDSSEEDIYMTDGSYIQVASEMYPGKVSWAGSDHSAITTSQQGVFISKWWLGPLAEHAFDDNPFGGIGLKYYVSTKINGSLELLCQSASRSFSTVDIPGATYSWSVGGGLTKIENGNSVTVTAISHFTGETSIEVTITSPLGNNQFDIKTSKKLYFTIGGTPAPTVDPSGFPPIQMGIYSYKDIAVTNYPGSATWSSSGVVETIWSDGQTGRFYSTEEGEAYFFVTTHNECGDSPMYQGSIIVLGDMMDSTDPSDEESFWTISPNPSKTHFDISYASTEEKITEGTFRVDIFDANSRLKQTNRLTGTHNRIILNNFKSEIGRAHV